MKEFNVYAIHEGLVIPWDTLKDAPGGLFKRQWAELGRMFRSVQKEYAPKLSADYQNIPRKLVEVHEIADDPDILDEQEGRIDEN